MAGLLGEKSVSPDLFRRRARWALGVVSRGRWIIVAVFLLMLAPAITYLYKAERLYTARVSVLIEAPDIGDNLLERSYGKSRLNEAAVQTEADIMQSRALAEKVIGTLDLDQDPEFNTTLRPPSLIGEIVSAINPLPYLVGQTSGEQALSPEGKDRVLRSRIEGMFLSRLLVTTSRRSYVVTIDFTANNGEKAARIANTLADMYIVDRLDVSLEETRRANQWLSQRLEELRHDVAIAEQAAEGFRSKHNLASVRKGDRQQSVLDQQLVELNSRLVLARSDYAQRQARSAQLRAGGAVETSSDVLQSSLIQRLREQEASTQRELSEALKSYGEQHPRIIGLRADLQELRSKIGQEISKVGVSLTADTEASRAAVQSLEQQIKDLQKGSNTAGEYELQLRELERQAETSRSLYESFLGRYKRDAEQESIQRANARVLSEAAIPVRPSSPRQMRVIALAFMMSLVGGVGLVFLLDRLNGRIRSAEEVEQITDLPLLASIPWVKSAKKEALAHAILDAPRSGLANAFRSLRAVLDAPQRGTGRQGGKVTLVTSSVPGEGKSFVSRNLAMALAAVGRRVLVIDGDLLRPTQHLLCEVAPEKGLTQALLDPALDPMSLLIRDERGGFDLLPAGKIEVFSGNALASGHFETVLATLASHYDRIVIDASPCLATTDAQALCAVSDGVVFVVKWNETPRDAVLAALAYLDKVGARVTGIALSQVKLPANGRRGYGSYGYYGSYGAYDGYVKN